MAHSNVSARDRSADNKMGTLGLFSDLNYTTIGDPYDDSALRRMLGNRLGVRLLRRPRGLLGCNGGSAPPPAARTACAIAAR